MELSDDEQVLYDFFIAVGQLTKSIDYPLAILNTWTSGDEGAVTTGYIYKDKVINAYGKPGVMDKPLYLAIKEIKGWA
ncbi:hypothetical protein [Limosilactobacillus reuteri]|uniref:hypothetical protein n=1 Tax=Limosilactobacillus reuteri TaxID=1598 RepID=UPI002B06212F|nr:hypothetical protein [Limosilactobacillus reuteri]